jgi:hypothetical protein
MVAGVCNGCPRDPVNAALELFFEKDSAKKDGVEVVLDGFGFRRAGDGKVTLESNNLEAFRTIFLDYPME